MTRPSTLTKHQHAGLARLLPAARHAAVGLRATWLREAAFRQEVLIALPLAALACVADVTGMQRALLLASLLGVLVVELLNSAVEAVVDLVSPEHHPLAGIAKDAGAAAVMLALAAAALTWALVFLSAA